MYLWLLLKSKTFIFNILFIKDTKLYLTYYHIVVVINYLFKNVVNYYELKLCGYKIKYNFVLLPYLSSFELKL